VMIDAPAPISDTQLDELHIRMKNLPHKE
jgi:aspartyl-tRNA synthetase